jgi:hypothetical protein
MESDGGEDDAGNVRNGGCEDVGGGGVDFAMRILMYAAAAGIVLVDHVVAPVAARDQMSSRSPPHPPDLLLLLLPPNSHAKSVAQRAKPDSTPSPFFESALSLRLNANGQTNRGNRMRISCDNVSAPHTIK